MSGLLKTRVRWLRFSLRSLILCVTVAGVALMLSLRWYDKGRRQHEAVVALASNICNTIWYEKQRDPETDSIPVPQFLSGLLSFDHFYKVVDVSLNEANDDQMRLLKDFPDLEKLCLWSTSQCTDAGFAEIKSFKRLKVLDLFVVSGVNDRTLEVIGSMKDLQHLRLGCGNNVSDAGVAHLSRLHGLRSLRLQCGLGVTDRGLAFLSDLSNLERLELDLDDATNVTLELVDLSWLNVSFDRPIRGHALRGSEN